ncbi:MAG: hypothetical protein LQ338_005252 [Usnochroma carphineum]|nr:MAG: hypothetical protein LQ338_005252 [Usnochroma carphineum]
MAHKRNLSNGEAPHKRRLQSTASEPGQLANPPILKDQYVYIAIEEMSGPHLETEETFRRAYATLEDANRSLLWRQREAEDWDGLWEDEGESYDSQGCFNATAEDDEGDELRLYIQRLLVKPPGSVPPLPMTQDASSPSEDPRTDNLTTTGKSQRDHVKCKDSNCGDLACAGHDEVKVH